MELPRSMDPGTRTHRGWDVNVPLQLLDDRLELVLPFPENGRERSWLIASLKKSDALGKQKPPLPYKIVIKHGQLPLDLVKGYVLEWEGREEHPRLYATREDIPTIRQYVLKNRQADAALGYLATGDEKLGRKLADGMLARLQGLVDRFLKQPKWAHRGDAPHRTWHQLKRVINFIDAIMDAPFLSERERRIMRAQLAFVAYQFASPDVLSPERGWSANPNMTCDFYVGLGELACLLRSHPLSQKWFERAKQEIELDLETWAGPNGGWLEAPHYFVPSIEAIISLSIASEHSGFKSFRYDSRLKQTMLYFARLLTPSDPDVKNYHLVPAVGNTYHGETSCLPGWMAKLWAERDCAYSEEMQWAWHQQGLPRHIAIGSLRAVSLELYDFLFLDPSLPQKAPDWQTEYYPAIGVVFRSAFRTGRETYMLFRHGPFAEHWDHDEGSIILYGKGKPLVRDWSYNPYTPDAWLHNRVVNNHSNGRGSWDEWSAVQLFARLGHADYVRERQIVEAGREGPITFRSYKREWPFRQREPNADLLWQGQILFVKDDAPTEPSYFMLGDSTSGETWMEWCLWVVSDGPLDISTNPVKVKGKYDVDMDVYFSLPEAPELHTLHAEQKGLGPKISQELIHFAQRAGAPVLTVLYPYVRGREKPPTYERMPMVSFWRATSART